MIVENSWEITCTLPLAIDEKAELVCSRRQIQYSREIVVAAIQLLLGQNGSRKQGQYLLVRIIGSCQSLKDPTKETLSPPWLQVRTVGTKAGLSTTDE